MFGFLKSLFKKRTPPKFIRESKFENTCALCVYGGMTKKVGRWYSLYCKRHNITVTNCIKKRCNNRVDWRRKEWNKYES